MNRKLFTMLMLLLLPGALSNAAVGFLNGNQMMAFTAQGNITVQCLGGPGPQQTAYFTCQGGYLNPSETDYFVGPAGVKADSVDLTATHADGKTRTKSSNYDSTKGQSSNEFNLWLASLFQRPLLDVGLNKIQYTLKAAGNTVQTGEFDVTVDDAGIKECVRDGFYTSANASDCQTGTTTVCDQYFYDNNYCL